MMYDDFLAKLEKYNYEWALSEHLYFKAIEMLRNVQQHVNQLDINLVQRVIHVFLLNWGTMGRVVLRKDLDWMKLVKVIHGLESDFKTLYQRKLLHTDLSDSQIENAIKKIYTKIIEIKNLGPTSVSKILHLLNPEFFVMWDNRIMSRSYGVRENASGYLDFLRQVATRLSDMFHNRQNQTGETIDEIEKNLSQRFGKPITKLIDEYNWMTR